MFSLFLNPIMLLGMGAVSVPILIHLLNRRKFERVAWAAMRFLRVSIEQNQRRIRIEDLILLALRCLLLVLLALALARPVMRAAGGMLGQAKVSAVVILDNSYSMSQTDGVEQRFDAAKKAAEQAIRDLPTGSSVAVLLASDIAEALIPEPTHDLTAAASTLKEAEIYDRPTNLLPALSRAVEILRGRKDVRKEIYLITDGQSSGWRQMADIQALLEQNAREVRAHVVLVGQSEERNLGITALRLDSGLVPVNRPVRMEVRIRNFGRSEARDVNVSIAVNADPPMDQTTVASIPGGEERSASLFARFRNDGHHTVTARIDPDHLPADDTRAMALRAVRDVKVLLIDGDTGAEPRDSEVFYLRQALRAVPRAEREAHHIKPAVRTPTELESVVFEDYDAVVAANVTDLPAPVTTRLVNYLREGGSLVVFPGDRINRNFYNNELYRKHGIMPAMLGETRGDAKAHDTWLSLADRGYDHDIVSMWRDPTRGTLSSVKFFKVYDLLDQSAERAENSEPAAPSSATRVVVRFSDNKPAVMERDFGRGRVLLFSSTADTEWNDLGARAGVFVPLIDRVLGSLVARQDEHLNLKVGQTFHHLAPLTLVNRDALITKRARTYNLAARDVNEVHEPRRIELIDGVPILQCDRTHFAGAYEVAITDAPPIRFAVQADADESTLETLNDEQVRSLESVSTVLRWGGGDTRATDFQETRQGREIWLPLAMAALVLATLETLLAHWFSRSK